MSWEKPKSLLNNKVMRLLGVVIAILLLGNGAIFSFVIWPTFDELEHREAEQNAQRVLEALTKEQEDLGRVTRDFSAWDPTYEYVVAPNEDYDRQTFTYDVMHDLEMQLIGIYDVNGRRIESKTVDLETGADIAIGPFSSDLPADHPLLSHTKTNGITGILLTEHGPMLLASFPILQSTREGPVRGSFFMGRLLTDTMIKALGDQTHVRFNVFRTDQHDLPVAERSAANDLANGQEYTFASDGQNLATYEPTPTLMDGASLLIKAETPRRISAIGRTTLALAGFSTIFTALLVMAVIWVMLTRLIVAPLNRLTTHVVAVGQTGDLTRRVALDRNDEIGVLSKEFDAAVEQLDNVRRRLLEQSYQSGMAEIAAGVIHNVRNALSPVVVTVSHLSEVATMPPAAHLDAAFTDLKANSTSPERRQMLVQYVEEAMKAMLERGRRFAEDLKTVAEQNRHIEQILQDHTALSMGARRLEPVNPTSVVEEAARFIPAQDSTVVELRVGPGVDKMPAVNGHPIVVAQILGNLMVNAAEAIRETGRGSGWIAVDAALERENGRTEVHLTVRDNGSGIDQAVFPNLFGRGFSTKKGKTGGIGLHWSANSVAGMGGRMYAECDGRGRGACFHVVLPVASKVEDIAA
jgi:two-component system, NtrC family, sensor kinase